MERDVSTTLIVCLRDVGTYVGSLWQLEKSGVYPDARAMVSGLDDVVAVGVGFTASHLHQVLVGALAFFTGIILINPVVLQVVVQGYIFVHQPLSLVREVDGAFFQPIIARLGHQFVGHYLGVDERPYLS